MFTEEHLYSIALRKCKLIGDIHFSQLVKIVGSAQEVWSQSEKGFKDFELLKGKKLADIGNPEHLKFAEKEILFCEKNNVKIALNHQNDFPFLLEQIEDAPAILYMKGELPKLNKFISLVGTRKITHYGKDFLHDFFKEVKPHSFVSVSGLALGTDTLVHQNSLEAKIPTIGVLAHGFHMLYPSQNKSLAQKIINEGGMLITEFNSSQKPDKEHFIQRNRVVAGLATATVIIESPYAGGSISTATFANNYNRDVYALPGKITDICSQGCNKLIFEHKARAIVSIKSLLKELQVNSNENSKIESLFPSENTLNNIPKHLKSIYEIIFHHPNIYLDEIILKTTLSSQQISGFLLELELLGLIRVLSGKQYIIK